jgi:hypothetical protein
MKKYLYGIGCIVILLLIAWGLLSLSSKQNRPQPSDPSLGMLVESNAIVVSDQKPADRLIMTKIFFDRSGPGGYVVVHKDANGVPGDSIGTSIYLEPGEYDNVAIDLTATVTNGETLYAMLHNDDGDALFDAQKDLPVVSTVIADEPIMGMFVIDENAELPGAVIY